MRPWAPEMHVFADIYQESFVTFGPPLNSCGDHKKYVNAIDEY